MSDSRKVFFSPYRRPPSSLGWNYTCVGLHIHTSLLWSRTIPFQSFRRRWARTQRGTQDSMHTHKRTVDYYMETFHQPCVSMKFKVPLSMELQPLANLSPRLMSEPRRTARGTARKQQFRRKVKYFPCSAWSRKLIYHRGLRNTHNPSKKDLDGKVRLNNSQMFDKQIRHGNLRCKWDAKEQTCLTWNGMTFQEEFVSISEVLH